MMTRDEGDWWKNDFFVFSFHKSTLQLSSTRHFHHLYISYFHYYNYMYGEKNNVIKEMGKNCCNTSVSFFQYYTQHKPSLMSILKKACKKELIKKIYMAWFLIIAATLFPKYLLWRRVQNQEIFFLHHSTV